MGPKYHAKSVKGHIGEECAHSHLFGDILGPAWMLMFLLPLVSSIATIRNYPRGATLDPTLLSCSPLDFHLFTLKSVIRV